MDNDLREALVSILPGQRLVESEDTSMPDLIARPKNTEQVADILKLCHEYRQGVIPIGGKTGLVGGLQKTGDEIGLSMELMNQVEEIDSINRTMTVQAGTILQVACEAAEQHGLMLPLDLGARGSCTVGGTVATNAGGNRVIRYGMVRDMVLGLEVVLADGTVVSSLNKMIKNNAGYDLKQMFIGSEGTLGVVTKIVYRLKPLPYSQDTALLAVNCFDKLTSLLHHIEAKAGGRLSAFEVMWPSFYEHITRENSAHRPPLPHGSSYYVLVETLGVDQCIDSTNFETFLGEALEQDLIDDAVIAKSQSERDALWAIRDDVLEFYQLGPAVIFDVSVTIDKMPEFICDVEVQMAAIADPISVIFGHLGDSNLHLMLGSKQAEQFDKAKIERIVYDSIGRVGGSVSAEHGIGLEKRSYLHQSRNNAELTLMKSIKNHLDPRHILNPNKIFTVAELESY